MLLPVRQRELFPNKLAVSTYFSVRYHRANIHSSTNTIGLNSLTQTS